MTNLWALPTRRQSVAPQPGRAWTASGRTIQLIAMLVPTQLANPERGGGSRDRAALHYRGWHLGPGDHGPAAGLLRGRQDGARRHLGQRRILGRLRARRG